MAGNLAAVDNQLTWSSTQCTAPIAPESVTSVDRHAAAEDVNKRITDYNIYVAAAQTYMECVNKEAQTDSTNANQIIIQAAQKIIDDKRKDVADFGAPLQPKK